MLRRRVTFLGWLTGPLALGLMAYSCGLAPPGADLGGSGLGRLPTTDDQRWYQAITAANQAAQLAQTAASSQDWLQVSEHWGKSLVLLSQISTQDQRSIFSQRRAQEYLRYLQAAQQRARQQGFPRVFPALGSNILDEQLSTYYSYVAALGPPDILIVGSSRALQGIDPQALEQSLAALGHPGLRVYNFGVNGATAQVVSFLMRQLLGPDLLPRMVIWAEGSRGFNSGRLDRTFAEILASPGYATVQGGQQLTLPAPPAPSPEQGTIPASPITSQGFLKVNDQFNPAQYYQAFPRVRGAYDDAYRYFRLDGVQRLSLEAVVAFLQERRIPLVFINLPLSNDYLDPARLRHEREFQAFLETHHRTGGMVVIDLLEQWRWQSHFFADPSHINLYGARKLAGLIADHPRFPRLSPEPPD